jgi:hypothetical protein
MRTLPLLVAGVGGALLFCATAAAQALRCDRGAVEMDDSTYAVESKCGAPTFADVTRVTRVSERDDALLEELVDVEDWLYDFGAERLVVVLTFERDRLKGVRGFGYGRAPGEGADFRKAVALGEPTVRLLFLYGPPSDKDERLETTVLSRKDGATVPRQRTVATWTYNLGPNRFQRIYRFVDGRLTAIEQGPRGF